MKLRDTSRFDALKSFDQELLAAFSEVAAIELAIYDNQLCFRAVNKAAVATPGIAPEDFVGRRIRDIVGDAGVEPEAHVRDVLATGESATLEVCVLLPGRAEPGYWVQKIFPKVRSGNVTHIVSLAIEVTNNRRLEKHLRALAGELLWNDQRYERLARELHNSVNQYHLALGMSLDRFSRCIVEPETIPELLASPPDFLNESMSKLARVVAECFPIDPQ